MGTPNECGLKYNQGTNSVKAWTDGCTDRQANGYKLGTRTSLAIQCVRKISGLAPREVVTTLGQTIQMAPIAQDLEKPLQLL